MEKQSKTIFYLTTGVVSGKEKRIPVYRCNRKFLYAEGSPSVAGNPVIRGELQICFGMLPATMERELGKRGRRKKWLKKIKAAIDVAQQDFGCTDHEGILFSPELCKLFHRQQDIPRELYGAYLWEERKRRNFHHVVIVLPKEYGFVVTEEVKLLLEPYLAGVNGITFIGKETEGTQELEDFFYQEYGIVSDYENLITDDFVCLNLQCEGEMLKLLDTAVKSGYNTKVN